RFRNWYASNCFKVVTQRRRLKDQQKQGKPSINKGILGLPRAYRLLRVARCCTFLVYQVSFQMAESPVIPALTHSDQNSRR
ncbi:hypothetical protein, partial [Sinorhizobium meliloti]|uniref:hypothetical protein n=1 Tax=Rhizobium meliloti TaxID=382 RepID=UPI001AECA799